MLQLTIGGFVPVRMAKPMHVVLGRGIVDYKDPAYGETAVVYTLAASYDGGSDLGRRIGARRHPNSYTQAGPRKDRSGDCIKQASRRQSVPSTLGS